MSEFTLVIGNKNYSSWSLRPWMLMKHLGLDFTEKQILLDTPTFKDEIARDGPAGRVPVLKHGKLTVWDSLAICEYLADLTGKGWPEKREARAVSAEMHAGFASLRMEWPFNARARNRRTSVTPALEADIDRIDEIWIDCRRHGADRGPWLFGEHSIADAMYAPVVVRFSTYREQVPDTTRAYMTTALEDLALQSWMQAARHEPWTLAAAEVG